MGRTLSYILFSREDYWLRGNDFWLFSMNPSLSTTESFGPAYGKKVCIYSNCNISQNLQIFNLMILIPHCVNHCSRLNLRSEAFSHFIWGWFSFLTMSWIIINLKIDKVNWKSKKQNLGWITVGNMNMKVNSV